MADAAVQFQDLKVKGEGVCIGGHHPDPPLDAYPLLCWSEDHPRFGRMTIHLEDNRASVEQVALALATTPSVEALTATFGTSPEHIRQAIDYAVAAGFLGR